MRRFKDGLGTCVNVRGSLNKCQIQPITNRTLFDTCMQAAATRSVLLYNDISWLDSKRKCQCNADKPINTDVLQCLTPKWMFNFQDILEPKHPSPRCMVINCSSQQWAKDTRECKYGRDNPHVLPKFEWWDNCNSDDGDH